MAEDKKTTTNKKDKSRDALSEQSDFGAIRVDEDVIASIAELTVLSIDGIAGMVGGMTDGITEIFGKRSVGKGIRVEAIESGLKVDVNIIVNYGISIPELAHRIQREVAEQVKTMTNISLAAVNVYIQGIHFSDETNEEVKGGTI